MPVVSVTWGLSRQTFHPPALDERAEEPHQPDEVIADAGLQPHGRVDGAGPPDSSGDVVVPGDVVDECALARADPLEAGEWHHCQLPGDVVDEPLPGGRRPGLGQGAGGAVAAGSALRTGLTISACPVPDWLSGSADPVGGYGTTCGQ